MMDRYIILKTCLSFSFLLCLILSCSEEKKFPEAPVIVLTSDKSSVTISWKSVDGASGYHLYQSEDGGNVKTHGTKFEEVSSPFQISSGLKGKNYFFVVTAFNENGESLPSEEKALLNSEYFLTINNIPVESQLGEAYYKQLFDVQVHLHRTENYLKINWEHIVDARQYRIYWQNFPFVSKSTAQRMDWQIPPFIHENLERETSYYYKIMAVSKDGTEIPICEELVVNTDI